jgi:NAD(P)-dependent dehydrogenase (short-subunit alcohol dehydrogenase family)
VCPGMVYTPMMYSGGMTDEARAARKNRSLLKTEGTGWDVGAAVRFLAGDEARWMTGMIFSNSRCRRDLELTGAMTGVILPVDAGATCATGSDVPKSASINPPK